MEPKNESKYERVRRIGVGSYGVVFKCIDRQTGQVVAIKRYSENDSDPVIRKIAMREVRMLRLLKHPNLIKLIDLFRRKRRIHLVFDYCELTVLDVIEKYSINCPLNLIKKITWQTVNAINYCHTHNCLHRDIKPENILINQAGVVKLCDFGFARIVSDASGFVRIKPELSAREANLSSARQVADNGNEENKVETRQALTEYVATRWYRAPELLIGETFYDCKIDIWALGCVTAELMRGEPIWPAKTDSDQLCMIKSSLGQLTNSQTNTLIKQSIYEQSTIEAILNQNATGSESIEKKLPSRVGQAGADFVLACLQMNPARRLNSDQLLRLPFIYSSRMPEFLPASNSKEPTSVSRGLAFNNNQQRPLADASATRNSQPDSSRFVGARLNSQALKQLACSPPYKVGQSHKRLLVALNEHSSDVKSEAQTFSSSSKLKSSSKAGQQVSEMSSSDSRHRRKVATNGYVNGFAAGNTSANSNMEDSARSLLPIGKTHARHRANNSKLKPSRPNLDNSTTTATTDLQQVSSKSRKQRRERHKDELAETSKGELEFTKRSSKAEQSMGKDARFAPRTTRYSDDLKLSTSTSQLNSSSSNRSSSIPFLPSVFAGS